jgi:hypothetical protein
VSGHWIELPTESLAQWCEWLRHFEAYCRRCAAREPSFVPEAEVAAELLALFERRGLDRASILDAIALVNGLVEVPHYCGSGWFDLCARLAGLCARSGVAVELERRGDRGFELVQRDG